MTAPVKVPSWCPRCSSHYAFERTEKALPDNKRLVTLRCPECSCVVVSWQIESKNSMSREARG